MRETTEKYWELVGEYCAVMQNNGVQVRVKKDKKGLFCSNVENHDNEYRSKYMKSEVKSLDRHKLAAIMVVEGLELNIINAEAIEQELEQDNINIASEKILMLAALDFLKTEINKSIMRELKLDSDTRLATIDKFSYPEPWAYLINGFRNKDIGKVIFPDMKDAKKRSSKTSRTIKKLRQHRLVKKVPRSRRYHVTSKGRKIMGVLIELYHKDYPELIAKAA